MQSFSLHGDVRRASPGQIHISRTFPLVVTPEMLQIIGISPDNLDENGILDVEHEIAIDIESRFNRGVSKSWSDPGDAARFDINDYYVLSIDGIGLNEEDANRLKVYLGELTDEEIENIEDTLFNDQ
jgi:hypothetical protein